MRQQIRNTARSATTTVGPMAVAKRSEIITPMVAEAKEMTTAQSVTPLNVLKSRIAERAGKIMRADASKAPSIFIASTTVTPTAIALTVL